ncbi:MAG: hypothetical protein QXS85_05745 [Acidilobaceae archaeon]
MSLRLKDKLEAAVRRYNELRAPEAVAEVVEVDRGRVYVVFSGRFCHTCGVVDWIEDLAYVMEEEGLRARLVDVLEPEDASEDYRVGVFEVEELESE